jgi:hypothetical protein
MGGAQIFSLLRSTFAPICLSIIPFKVSDSKGAVFDVATKAKGLQEEILEIMVPVRYFEDTPGVS